MIKSIIENYLKKIIKEDIDIEIFTPEQEQFGHYSTNIALKLAKLRNKNSMMIAEEIKNLIPTLPADKQEILVNNFFEKIEIAAPGFINFWISEKVLQNELKEILKQKEKYGRSRVNPPHPPTGGGGQ